MTRIRTQVEEAAEWAAGFQLDSAPNDVIDLATTQIANIIAAILAGSRSEAGQKVLRAMRPTWQPGPCTVIPHGERVSLWDVLYLHAVYANALELDDFHYRGHVGPAVVVVPMALAEAGGLDGRSLIRALIIGNELAGRLGWAITAEVRHGHQRSYLLGFAAAAAAAVLLDLDEHGIARALAIAMTQPQLPLHRGMFSPDTKVLSAATAVVDGVRAAYLAGEGISAARDILEHPAGFYRQYTMHRTVPSPFVQLGEAWCMHALSFKRYSACGYSAGAIDAVREIHADPVFDPTCIERFEIASSLPALAMERLAHPHEPELLTPVNVQFSIIRSVAAALSLGDLRGYHFEPAAYAAMLPAVRRLSLLGTLVHDWTFTIHLLRGLDAGLNRGGGGQSLDMLQFYRTSRKFRAMFGTVRAIGPYDFVRFASLPPEDRRYFARRWGTSLRSHLRPPARSEQTGPLGDLRKLSFCMGARVSVTLKSGRRLTAERIIPTGMAGDPDRRAMVREKLLAEGGPVLGRLQCERLWNAIVDLRAAATVTLASDACHNSANKT